MLLNTIINYPSGIYVIHNYIIGVSFRASRIQSVFHYLNLPGTLNYWEKKKHGLQILKHVRRFMII